MRFARGITLALLGILSAYACGTIFDPNTCTAELGMKLTPEATLAVGQSVTPSLELTSCGGRKRWHPTVVWRTADTSIVSIDSVSGRVTGRAPGSASITPVEHASNGDMSCEPLLFHVQ